MSGFFRRLMFVFDAAACGAVWAMLLVGLLVRSGAPTTGFNAFAPGVMGFGVGFLAGGVCGFLALQRIEEARQARALYMIVGLFVLGMVLLRVATHAGFGAF